MDTFDHPYRWRVSVRSAPKEDIDPHVFERGDAWTHREAGQTPNKVTDSLMKKQSLWHRGKDRVGKESRSLRLDETLTLYYQALRDNYGLEEQHPTLEQLVLSLISLEIEEAFKVIEYHSPEHNFRMELEYQHWWFKRIE